MGSNNSQERTERQNTTGARNAGNEAAKGEWKRGGELRGTRIERKGYMRWKAERKGKTKTELGGEEGERGGHEKRTEGGRGRVEGKG